MSCFKETEISMDAVLMKRPESRDGVGQQNEKRKVGRRLKINSCRE
jgi:hypothetical protein